MTLYYGLFTGILFGFLLQRAGVLRYEKQLGALRLRDMTIVKFMISFIIVGMVGLALLNYFGYASLQVKPTVIGANIIGGLLFGIGWGLSGLCPGTAVGAVGEGRWHALWVIVGMLFGAALYAEAYPFLKNSILKWGSLGKVTLPELLSTNQWAIVGLLCFYLAVIAVIEKKQL